MIVQSGKVTIENNTISMYDFKIAEETPVAVARIEILTWARQEIDVALKAEDNNDAKS